MDGKYKCVCVYVCVFCIPNNGFISLLLYCAATLDKRVTDSNVIDDILSFNPGWPKCEFSTKRRRRVRDINIINYIEEKLNGWDKYMEIAIDGLCGTGKSTLINSLNRKYQKINNMASSITQGSEYNHDPLKAMSYIMTQTVYVPSVPICWDRSAYSNLIFHYVHLLMAHYGDFDINVDDLPTHYRTLNSFAQDLHLVDTLDFLTNEKSIPVLFLVNSDICMVGMNLIKRGSLNDVYNAKEHNYLAAQCVVFSWFAEILDAPCIDINKCHFSESFNLTDLQSILRMKLNHSFTVNGDSCATTTNLAESINRTNDWITKDMSSMHQNNGLMYMYSAK